MQPFGRPETPFLYAKLETHLEEIVDVSGGGLGEFSIVEKTTRHPTCQEFG